MLSDPKTDRNRLTLCSCFCGVNLKGDHPPIVVLVVFCDVWSDLKTEEAGYELDWSTEDRRKLDNFIVGRCIRRSVLDEAFTWVPDPIADALAKVSTAPPLPHTRNGSHARVRPGATLSCQRKPFGWGIADALAKVYLKRCSALSSHVNNRTHTRRASLRESIP